MKIETTQDLRLLLYMEGQYDGCDLTESQRRIVEAFWKEVSEKISVEDVLNRALNLRREDRLLFRTEIPIGPKYK